MEKVIINSDHEALKVLDIFNDKSNKIVDDKELVAKLIDDIQNNFTDLPLGERLPPITMLKSAAEGSTA